MTIEQNKTLSRQFYEAYDKNDREAFASLLAPGCMVHLGAYDLSREAFLQSSGMFVAAFSDSHTTFEDQIAEGDKVITRWIWEITHVGEFQGIPATGRRIRLTGMTINHFRDGKIVEQWVNMDDMGLFKQMSGEATTTAA